MKQELTAVQKSLLKQGIEGLPFSTEFKDLMTKLGFQNLEQMSKYTIEELESMEGFDTLLMHEYGGFMVKNNLGELLEP